MKIILTHEQADFDGLASQLGAHLLDKTSQGWYAFNRGLG